MQSTHFGEEKPVTRSEAIWALVAAIRACHSADAVKILSAALDSLSVGTPLPPLVEAEFDAEFWADLATPCELEAYFSACAKRMTKQRLHGLARKRAFLSLWETFTEADRLAFAERYCTKELETNV